jgi:hypothetical protein
MRTRFLTLAALAAAFTAVSAADASRVMTGQPLTTAQATAPVKRGADPGNAKAKASLRSYFSSISRPLRLSLLWAVAVTNSIDGFLDHNDPPFLGQIARGCQRFRGAEVYRPFLRITAPSRLKVAHRGLLRAYVATRRSCERTSTTARTLAAAIDRFSATGSAEDKAALQRADAFARRTLPFEKNMLGSFTKAVWIWRSAALRYAALVGAPVPEWLRDMKVGP